MTSISNAYAVGMEVHQLRYVDLVAREESFTAAAARAQVSQSALSTQVAKLEKELGHRLFDRGRHGARPTDVGAVVVDRIRAALRALDAVTATAGEFAGLVVGSVALGAVVGCDLPGLAAGLAAFGQDHPGASLSYAEDSSETMVRDVLAGRLDLALVAHVGPLTASLETTTIMSSPLIAVVPASARERPRRLEDLAGEPLVTLPVGTGVRTALDDAARRAGVALRPAFEVHSATLVLELVRRGSGIGVLTGGMLAHTPEGLEYGTLADGGVSQLSLVRRRDPSPATAALTALLARELGAPSREGDGIEGAPTQIPDRRARDRR